jgi:predicted RNase H-like HicB family nuclease
MTRTFTVTADLIPEDEGGYTVYCPELDIYTQGETEDECLENLREAASLHIEEIGAANLAVKAVLRRTLDIAVHA